MQHCANIRCSVPNGHKLTASHCLAAAPCRGHVHPSALCNMPVQAAAVKEGPSRREVTGLQSCLLLEADALHGPEADTCECFSHSRLAQSDTEKERVLAVLRRSQQAQLLGTTPSAGAGCCAGLRGSTQRVALGPSILPEPVCPKCCPQTCTCCLL